MTRHRALLSRRGGKWICYRHGEIDPRNHKGLVYCSSRSAEMAPDSPMATYAGQLSDLEPVCVPHGRLKVVGDLCPLCQTEGIKAGGEGQ